MLDLDYLPACILTLFAIVMAAPLAYGLWRFAFAGAVAVVRVSRSCVAALVPTTSSRLLDAPLRPDLTREARRLGDATRDLVVSLEHGLRRSGGLATLSRDEDYRPTIGMTGEVWAWLMSAEQLVESDDPIADAIEPVTGAVRQALLGPGPLAPRLATIFQLLLGLDSEVRTLGGSPYRRGSLAPVGLQDRSTSSAHEDEEVERDPRRRRDAALKHLEPRIERVARRYAPDEVTREDLAQDMKLSVWTALARFRGEASLVTYAMRIAHHRGISFRRRRRLGDPIDTDVVDPGPGLDEQLERARKCARLETAMDSLPCGQREALTLRLEGLSYREIAERLGISDKAASVRITRARQRLRRTVSNA